MLNGTIADEQEALTACFAQLHLGERQVVRSMTRSGLQVPGDERMLSYLRENLEGLDEEALTDFLAKNREQYPIGPDSTPEDGWSALATRSSSISFGMGMDGLDFAGSFPSRMARSVSRGSGSTGA